MKTYTFTGFYHQSLHCQTLPSLSLYGERAATPADNAARSKKNGKLPDYVFVCSFVRRAEKKGKRQRGAVFILPLASLFKPREVCSINCFLFFLFFSTPQDTVRKYDSHFSPSLHLSDTTVI